MKCSDILIATTNLITRDNDQSRPPGRNTGEIAHESYGSQKYMAHWFTNQGNQ